MEIKKPRNNYPPPNAWIFTWVDYSKKYGIGYVLNDKSTGVFFNDGTKIIGGNESPLIAYIEKKEKVAKIYTIEDLPQELGKKLALLNHFKKFLVEKQTKKS